MKVEWRILNYQTTYEREKRSSFNSLINGTGTIFSEREETYNKFLVKDTLGTEMQD